MKVKRKIIIEILFLVLILVVLFTTINYLLAFKDENTQRWNGFLKIQNDTLDLVFIGNSHGVYSYIPMIFDDKLKIDSYNLCMQGSTIHQNYYQLREVFKTQKPKIIVLEMYSITLTNLVDVYQPYRVHAAFDSMPFSQNKLEALRNNKGKNNLMDYLIPMSIYHLRWKEKSLFEDVKNYLKTDYTDSPFNGYGIINSDLIRSYDTNELIIDSSLLNEEAIEISDDTYEILQRVINLCKKNNTQLIIVSSPYIAQDGAEYSYEYSIMNSLRDYFMKENIPLYDYSNVQDELGLNATHLYNDGHINYVGANIVSEYLSELLLNEYSDLLISCEWDYEDKSREKIRKLIDSKEDFVDEYYSLVD